MFSRAITAVLAACFVLLGCSTMAHAQTHVGLANPSFETALNPAADWTPLIVPAAGGYPGEYPSFDPSTPCPADSDPEQARRRICVVGADSFDVTQGSTTRTETVTPIDGAKMLRLGGPFNDTAQAQSQDVYSVSQRFVVDSANPQFNLNFNIFTFDYTGFDELKIRITVLDASGEPIFEKVRGSFGQGGDTTLKSTGWVGNHVNLAGYEGQELTVRISSGGTRDELFGFWTYIDAGEIPEPPVGSPDVTAPTTTPGGQPITVTVNDSGDGQTFYSVPASQASQFPDGPDGEPCLPLTFSVPINAGTATLSNVRLRLLEADGGQQQVQLVQGTGNTWVFPAGTFICARTGQLQIEYTATEGGDSETFTIPIGGITLIDPQGIVHDATVFAVWKLNGKSDAEARGRAAIGGATVFLQRKQLDGSFRNVLSADPGISPAINPQVTPSSGPSKGLYQWDVSAGEYRVVVSSPGYAARTSSVVAIPPPVLDLHVALTPFCGGQGAYPQGDGAYPGSGFYPGTYPGCTAPPACPGNTTGTYPTCTPVCPVAGTYPNCTTGGNCPAGTTGTPPNCQPTGGGGGGGTPPPAPPPAPPAAGTTQNASVKLKAGRRFKVDRLGRVTLGTATCRTAAARCRSVRSRLEVPRRPRARVFGSATLKVKPAQTRTLRVQLSPRARRALRRNPLRMRILVRSGTAKAKLRTVTVRR